MRQVEEADLRLLGKPVSTFYSNSRLTTSTFLLLIASIATSSLLAFRFVQFQETIALIGSAASTTVAFLYLFGFYQRQGQAVHLYQHGMIFTRRRKTQVILWPEIGEIYDISIGKPNSQDRLLKLQLIDGQRIRLKGFEGIRSLSRRINNVLAARLSDRIREVVSSGSWVRFGSKLAISSHGLQVGLKVLSWNEINQIEFDPDRGIQVRLNTGNAWSLRVPKSQIANMQLLESLLDWIRVTPSLSDELEYQVEDERASAVSEQFETTIDADPNDLLREGYEWDEIEDVMQGECTMDDLLSRGPRKRPRNPK